MSALPGLRVAIVGGGVSGCACAWRLLQNAASEAASPVAVTIFEMGRGPGGRASARRSRELPGMAVSHGCPLFHVPRVALQASSPSSFEALLSSLMSHGHIAEWKGSAGTLESGGSVSSTASASRGESDDTVRLVGTPAMSSVAEGTLKLASPTDGSSSLDMRFGTKVAEVKPQKLDTGVEGWELLDKEQQSLGCYDWVVVTSPTMSHPRHTMLYGGDPPMVVASKLKGNPGLTAAVEQISQLQFQGVQVVMLAWSIAGEDAPPVHALKQLPCDILEVANDEILAKVVRQTLEPPFAAVVLHSTAAFAAKHTQVFGSHSSAAQFAPASGSSDQEAAVATEMQNALDRLLVDRLGGRKLPDPSWGPVLHRWSSCFPNPQAKPDPSRGQAFVLPEARVAFAGDHVSQPRGCLAGALASGIEAAEGILQSSKQP
mmetsp:Transcript_44492/g.81257  ORF Transcript_44492/g.81257 Transcript_44492/m.81257 type:complete len:431 (-) Transcript_44492:16-1308(-)